MDPEGIKARDSRERQEHMVESYSDLQSICKSNTLWLPCVLSSRASQSFAFKARPSEVNFFVFLKPSDGALIRKRQRQTALQYPGISFQKIKFLFIFWLEITTEGLFLWSGNIKNSFWPDDMLHLDKSLWILYCWTQASFRRKDRAIIRIAACGHTKRIHPWVLLGSDNLLNLFIWPSKTTLCKPRSGHEC